MKSNSIDDEFCGIDAEFLGHEAAAEMNRYGSICNISEEDALSIAVHCMWLYRAAETLMKQKRNKKIGLKDLFDQPMFGVPQETSDQLMERVANKKSDEILKELQSVMRGETIDYPESDYRNPVAYDIEEKISDKDPNGIDQHTPGAKLDAGKVQASLLIDFGRALLAVAAVGSFGASKYTRGGWEHVPDGINRYTDALLRHILKEQVEELDPDSNLLHASHTAWNALSRLELLLRERETNETMHTGQK